MDMSNYITFKDEDSKFQKRDVETYIHAVRLARILINEGCYNFWYYDRSGSKRVWDSDIQKLRNKESW
jgi:hypothetical protein